MEAPNAACCDVTTPTDTVSVSGSAYIAQRSRRFTEFERMKGPCECVGVGGPHGFAGCAPFIRPFVNTSPVIPPKTGEDKVDAPLSQNGGSPILRLVPSPQSQVYGPCCCP